MTAAVSTVHASPPHPPSSSSTRVPTDQGQHLTASVAHAWTAFFNAKDLTDTTHSFAHLLACCNALVHYYHAQREDTLFGLDDHYFPSFLDGAPETYRTIRAAVMMTFGQSQRTKTEIFRLYDSRINGALDLAMVTPSTPLYASSGKNVVIVGGGVGGLRSAIEFCLEGCHVNVLEKRELFSRMNVLKLWSFTMQDLKSLGAKVFYPKFCVGGIQHIGIRRLQECLLKGALLLGTQFHSGCVYRATTAEGDSSGKWNATFVSSAGVTNVLPVDVLVGAEGENSVVATEFNFNRRETKAGTALGITCNFVNMGERVDSQLQEFAKAYFADQRWFKECHRTTGLLLENLVYFRDETHYLVMTAKRSALLEAGIILEDKGTTTELVHPSNVNSDALNSYVTHLATHVGLPPSRPLAITAGPNPKPDAVLFDFTKKLMSQHAMKILHSNPIPAGGSRGIHSNITCEPITHKVSGSPSRGARLVVGLVGDALMAPFWPQGTGANRAVLSSLDLCWSIRRLSSMEKEKHSSGRGDFSVDEEAVLKERDGYYKAMQTLGAGHFVEDKFELSLLHPEWRYSQRKRRGSSRVSVNGQW